GRPRVHARAQPASDRLDLRGPRADARVQRPGRARPREHDARAEAARGQPVRLSLRSSVAVLLVVALVLAAVGTAAYLYAGGEPDYDPVAVAVPDGTPPAQQPPDPALASFYDQRLEWA